MLLIFATIITVAVVFIALWVYFDETTQCPRCKKFHAKKDIDAQWLGRFEKGTYIGGGRNRRWAIIPHEKYTVTHHCQYCHYEWVTTETKKLYR